MSAMASRHIACGAAALLFATTGLGQATDPARRLLSFDLSWLQPHERERALRSGPVAPAPGLIVEAQGKLYLLQARDWTPAEAAKVQTSGSGAILLAVCAVSRFAAQRGAGAWQLSRSAARPDPRYQTVSEISLRRDTQQGGERLVTTDQARRACADLLRPEYLW
jgi:hypothetical protein